MLAKILGGLGFVCGLIGIGGLCGAIEHGTGTVESLVLIVVAFLLVAWSAYEDGNLRHKKRTPHRPK